MSRLATAVAAAAAATAAVTLFLVAAAAAAAVLAAVQVARGPAALSFLPLPVWQAVLAAAAADLHVIAALGKLRLYRLQAVLANVTLVAPANVLLTAAFYALTPLRWAWVQTETCAFTWVISIFSLRPSLCSANWDQLLDAFTIGYKAVLDLAKDKIPTDDILAMPAGSDEARGAIRAACDTPIFAALRSAAARALPPSVVQSFLFRVAFAVAAQPLLAWWLVGFAYVPLVSATGPDSGPAGNAVNITFPKCKFLVKAQAKYGEEKGWTACNNECMLGMDEMFAGDYGILSWRMDVRPDRASGACTACLLPTPAPNCTAKDIEDLV